MPASHVFVILRREYRVRLRTRAFWISTFGFPLLALLIVTLPVLLLTRSTTSHRLVVVDTTGHVAPLLLERLAEREREGRRGARFEITLAAAEPDAAAQHDALDARVLGQQIDAWLRIDSEGLAHNRVEYRSDNVSNLLTQQLLEVELSGAVRRARLQEAGYDETAVDPLVRSVRLESVRVSAQGSRVQGGQAQFFLAYALAFLLYAVLAIYGAQVMNGVLEEKNSHVVELVLSTVRPLDLMAGKLIGIGLVGLTQLAIWIGLLLLVIGPLGAGALGGRLPNVELPVLDAGLALHFFALFVVGYFLYASFYAAIGAASSNLQEAQQLAFVAVFVLLASFMLFLPVVNDPDSTLSVTASLIPLFSPLVMMLRISVKTPPAWQIALSYALALGFVAFMVWTCARIYRIGILMHGKRPTLRELWRWARTP